MAQNKQPKYRKFLGFIYVGISAILIYTLTMSVFRVIERRQDYAALTEKKAELEKDKAELAKTVELLDDEDYVVRYAREHYIFSKDGEEVVKLPESKE
ncbi:MAG: septum formation initiator family protein [Coprobacillus sp.]